MGRPRTKGPVEVPQLLDMAEVAAIMATSTRHIRRLVSERRIRYLKVGHFVRFDEAEIIAWLDERRVHVSSYERAGRRQ